MAVNNTEEVVKLIWRSANAAEALALRERIRILNDDWEDLVISKLETMFTNESVRNRMKPLISTEVNIYKKVVNETAMVYRGKANRYAAIEETPDPRYEEIVKESRINQVLQQANRYTRAVNHVLIRPLIRKGKMEYDIVLPDQFELYTSEEDWKDVVAVKIYTGSETGSQNRWAFSAGMTNIDRRTGYIWVSRDALLVHDGQNIRLAPGVYRFNHGIDQRPVLINEFPYQLNGENVLPFVLTYKDFPVESLLNFTSDSALADSALMVSVLLTYANELMKFQSFKQVVITGDTDLKLPSPMQAGPGTIHKLLSQNATADMKVVDMDGPIDKVVDVILKRVQIILAQYGIPPSAITLSGTPQSGYAMRMDRSGLEEIRNADVENWRDFEHELFIKTRMVNNTDGKGVLPVISEEAEFHIDFAEPDYPNNPTEEGIIWQTRISNNVATPVDWIKSDNPDLDDDEAMELYMKNKAINNPTSNVMPLTVPTAGERTKPVMPVVDQEDDNIPEDDGK